MTRSTRRSHVLIGLLAGIGASAFVGDASADNSKPHPAVIQLQKGYGGPEGEQGGPGTEQSFSEILQVDKAFYVVTIWMSSDVSDEDAPWQGKCSSVMLSAKDSPRVVADQVQISAYHDGDRLFNHPIGASNGNARLGQYGNLIVYAFGSDGNVDGNDNANVQTYAGVIDHMCKVVSEPIRISENANNNEGAPAGVFNTIMDGNAYFTFGYLSQGDNDISYARGLVLHSDGTLEKTYLTDVVTPANIGRPTIAAASADRSMFCAAKGDNRPPEVGVECAYLDAISGAISVKDVVAHSDENVEPKVYMNQPQLALMDNGRIALQVVQSDGSGKNNNNKGANLDHLYMYQPSDQGFQELDHISNIGPYQTHPTICSGRFGVDGTMTLAMMDSSVTGVGEPGMQMAPFLATDQAFAPLDKFGQKWVVGFYGDSGYLANLYGQNPNTQGRDFLRCLGDVPNPGHGIQGGYMPTVETFFVAPHSGRQAMENKNALFVSFVPAKTDVPVDPAPPEPVSSGDPPDPGTTSGGTTDPPDPSGGVSTNPTQTQLPGQAKSGCACSTQGSGDSGAPGALALVGLAMLFVSRRRREG